MYRIIKRPDGSDWELGHGAFGRVVKGLRAGVQVSYWTPSLESPAINAKETPFPCLIKPGTTAFEL